MKKCKWRKNLASIVAISALGMGILLCGTGERAVYAADGDVAIDETNFPDEVFREYVQTELDSDGNGILSIAECAAVTEIKVYESEIFDLHGIEFFTELTTLDCKSNNLSSLDVSGNVNLINLNCSHNNLSSLDVSQNVNLEILYCSANSLTSLDVSQNVNLIDLNCSDNSLSSLDVTQNLNLEHLFCWENNLSSLDVSQNIDLTNLYCAVNSLSSLDVSRNVNLKALNCHANNLSSLDVSQNVNLGNLDCCANNLSSLDVSRNVNLWLLNCWGNNLSGLDLTWNSEVVGGIIQPNDINAMAYQEGANYYIDMNGFPLDQSRISNPSIGSYDNTNGRIILTTPVQVGDTLTYDYATGYTGSEQQYRIMKVNIQITEVKEESSTTENPSTESTTENSSTESITETAASTNDSTSDIQRTTASQKQDTPKTGDSTMPGRIIMLGIFSISSFLIGKWKRKS